jgi:hypothetical protein
MDRALVIAVGLLIVVAAWPCSAQEQAPPVATTTQGATALTNPDVNEVILYQGRNFQGDSLTLQAPEELPNLDKTSYGGWSERMKSLKVGADVIVVMFSRFNYGGGCMVFRGGNVGGVTGRYPDLTKYRFDASRTKSLKVFLKSYPERICEPMH